MHSERLLTLANHLKVGNLGHKKFDYSELNSLSTKFDIFSYDENGCGTVGCAIGECPIIWRSEWKFSNVDHGMPYAPVLNNRTCPEESAMEWFNINENEADFLFYPGWDDNPLKMSATKEQVANHIEKFVTYGGIYPKYYRLPKFASKQKASKKKEFANA